MKMINNNQAIELIEEIKNAEGYEARLEGYNKLLELANADTGFSQDGEHKSEDADGDLVTLEVGENTIKYIRRSHVGDVDGLDDGVLEITLTNTGEEILVS